MPGDVIDARLQWEGGVEDDTQTLDLGGRWNLGVVVEMWEVVWFGQVELVANQKDLGFIAILWLNRNMTVIRLGPEDNELVLVQW